MKPYIESALSFDAFDAAERITGNSYKSDDLTTLLGIHMMQENSSMKEILLKKSNDTYSYRQTLKEWTDVIEDIGFKLQLCEDIPDGKGNKLRIYWMPGLLMRTDSYWGDASVNSASVYFNFKGPRSGMFSCSNGHIGKVDGQDVWGGDRDAREGLRFSLNKMSSEGEILEKWLKPPHLWLLSYADTKVEGYDYDAINAKRIASLSDEIRQSIGL